MGLWTKSCVKGPPEGETALSARGKPIYEIGLSPEMEPRFTVSRVVVARGLVEKREYEAAVRETEKDSSLVPIPKQSSIWPSRTLWFDEETKHGRF